MNKQHTTGTECNTTPNFQIDSIFRMCNSCDREFSSRQNENYADWSYSGIDNEKPCSTFEPFKPRELARLLERDPNPDQDQTSFNSLEKLSFHSAPSVNIVTTSPSLQARWQRHSAAPIKFPQEVKSKNHTEKRVSPFFERDLRTESFDSKEHVTDTDPYRKLHDQHLSSKSPKSFLSHISPRTNLLEHSKIINSSEPQYSSSSSSSTYLGSNRKNFTLPGIGIHSIPKKKKILSRASFRDDLNINFPAISTDFPIHESSLGGKTSSYADLLSSYSNLITFDFASAYAALFSNDNHTHLHEESCSPLQSSPNNFLSHHVPNFLENSSQIQSLSNIADEPLKTSTVDTDVSCLQINNSQQAITSDLSYMRNNGSNACDQFIPYEIYQNSNDTSICPTSDSFKCSEEQDLQNRSSAIIITPLTTNRYRENKDLATTDNLCAPSNKQIITERQNASIPDNPASTDEIIAGRVERLPSREHSQTQSLDIDQYSQDFGFSVVTQDRQTQSTNDYSSTINSQYISRPKIVDFIANLKITEKHVQGVDHSVKFVDDVFEHRFVMLPRNHPLLSFEWDEESRHYCLAEAEWRALGIRQTRGWEHVGYSSHESHILLFRRLVGTDPRTGAVCEEVRAHALQRMEQIAQWREERSKLPAVTNDSHIIEHQPLPVFSSTNDYATADFIGHSNEVNTLTSQQVFYKHLNQSLLCFESKIKDLPKHINNLPYFDIERKQVKVKECVPYEMDSIDIDKMSSNTSSLFDAKSFEQSSQDKILEKIRSLYATIYLPLYAD